MSSDASSIGGTIVTLKIIHGKPPNYDAVIEAFPFAKRPGTMFCYGRAIHIPSGGTVSAALQAHETVHAERQGHDPAGWWARYLVDPQFRFDEELPAHIAEYRWFDGKPRAERRFMLRQIAARLAGPLYGRMVTVHRAKQLITGKINPDA